MDMDASFFTVSCKGNKSQLNDYVRCDIKEQQQFLPSRNIFSDSEQDDVEPMLDCLTLVDCRRARG